MNKRITIILGAGFSKLAGLPLASELKDRLSSNHIDRLFQHSSGEWEWKSGELTTQHYQSNGSEACGFSYILQELVETYGTIEDYEDFFQYIVDLSIDRYLPIIESAKAKFFQKSPKAQSSYLNPFKKEEQKKLIQILSFLIDQMLRSKKTIDELKDLYQSFIDIINEYEQVDIFTLNHDILLEQLLEANSIKYKTGFSKLNSNIKSGEKMLDIFNSDFSDVKVAVHKMHSSINCYRFDILEDSGSMLHHTGEFIYYQTNDYEDYQNAQRIDTETGKALQTLNYNITPQFITGKKKKDLIESDYMYSNLYERFINNIAKTDTILISGYSFGDTHIDEYLKQTKAKLIVNQNPGIDCELFKHCNNVKYMDEAKKILINYK
jgi:hypothetical protein